MFMKLNEAEYGRYILRRIGLLVAIMNINKIFHHIDRRVEESNAMYVYSNVVTFEDDESKFEGESYNVNIDIDDVPVVCYDSEYTFREMINHDLYDILITINEKPVVLYRKDSNTIYATDFFHRAECLPVAVVAMAKLVDVVDKKYPEVLHSDVKVAMLADIGDVVVDLWSGKKYPKFEVGEQLKNEIVEVIRNALKGR